jgi:hypothetical protein
MYLICYLQQGSKVFETIGRHRAASRRWTMPIGSRPYGLWTPGALGRFPYRLAATPGRQPAHADRKPSTSQRSRLKAGRSDSLRAGDA